MPRDKHFQISLNFLLTFVSPADSFIQDHFTVPNILKRILPKAGWNGVFSMDNMWWDVIGSSFIHEAFSMDGDAGCESTG